MRERERERESEGVPKLRGEMEVNFSRNKFTDVVIWKLLKWLLLSQHLMATYDDAMPTWSPWTQLISERTVMRMH